MNLNFLKNSSVHELLLCKILIPGKRAVQRGPLVYCLEQADNGNMDEAQLDEQMQFAVQPGSGKLGGMKILKAGSGDRELTFIPYFAWDNRGAGKMKVWISESNGTTTSGALPGVRND